jgi:crotonobetainyl-CoA:carnitine CoA-transferase CaiB-like acyl-CoA transferase
MSGVLSNLKVVEFGDQLSVAQAGNIFADFGAEVISIEPLGGAQLRRQPGFAFLARGKKSIVLDYRNPTDQEVVRSLMAQADVVITSERVKDLKEWQLDSQSICAINARLVYAQLTSFGTDGPLSDVKTDDALSLARMGINQSFAPAKDRPGPAWCSIPWAAWSGAQVALQGVFAALRERETSGLGQSLTVSLAHAVGGLDPWSQTNAALAQIFPDAFKAGGVQYAPDGSPYLSYAYKLLVAITKDGHWLQFSQVQPRLFRDFMTACGFDWMYEDERWGHFMKTITDTVMIPPETPSEMRFEFWNLLYDTVQSKTLAEWQEIFDQYPNVFAEVFRRGTDVLHHKQFEVESQVTTIVDRDHGPVLQPAALVRLSQTPAVLNSDAPRLDEHGAALRQMAESVKPEVKAAPSNAPSTLPLEGLTVLELSTFYAAPYGSTVLTDLGARVIKIEALDGEPMRMQQAFPEAGAMKVLQGKESVALDLGSPDAVKVLSKIAEKVDLVMCGFRAGAADRLGVGFAAMKAINPNIMYLDCPGFGILPPYGARPAFAPTMSAGSGISMRNVGAQIPAGVPSSHEEIRKLALKLSSGGMSAAAQPDGVAAYGVGTALAFAAYMQAVGVGGQQMLTTMLNSCAHALGQGLVEFNGRWEQSTADIDLYGFSALERLYEAQEGWVCLSATSNLEWEQLVKLLAGQIDLASDDRFQNSSLRDEHDAELIAVLTAAFAQRSALDWEADALALDVPLVSANQGQAEHLAIGEFATDHGMVARVVSPVVGEYPRIAPYQKFSRSKTQALPGNTKGQHTKQVLAEAGFTAEEITAFADQGLILLG